MTAHVPTTVLAADRPAARRLATALGALAVLAFAVLLWIGPVPQDQRYHDFADARTLLGIPNAVNVLSNLPFLAIGLAGLAFCLGPHRRGAAAAWSVFFAGIALVGVGSAYYHLAPADATLVWDRLPIAAACMGLLVAVLAEHMHPRLERYLLGPALAAGVASVLWWSYTGDLRPYIAAQALPLLAIPLALALAPGRHSHRVYLLYGLTAYGAAKAAELYDRAMYAYTTGLISGHSLKHLLAALGAGCMYLMLRRRVHA